MITRKEAIRIFESRLKFLGRANITGGESAIDLIKLSLAALRYQEERENPERLTIEQLKGMNCPVWLSCKTLEGASGYWCICQNGLITCPSGRCFDAEEIPHWEFYRYERKEM